MATKPCKWCGGTGQVEVPLDDSADGYDVVLADAAQAMALFESGWQLYGADVDDDGLHYILRRPMKWPSE